MQAIGRAGNADKTSIVVHPSIRDDESVRHQEVSHVFHCMQCDLQFQLDIAVTSRNGSDEIDERVVHIRLDPGIKIEREEETS
jgi:hypothetical protein